MQSSLLIKLFGDRLRKKPCFLSGTDVRLSREQYVSWEPIVIVMWFSFLKSLWSSNLCHRNAQNTMELYCPFCSAAVFMYEMCFHCDGVLLFVLITAFWRCRLLNPSEARQCPWYFWLALKSEKVNFYLLFKDLIHKARGLNCCARPVVSNESHSDCSCIHLHVFSA